MMETYAPDLRELPPFERRLAEMELDLRNRGLMARAGHASDAAELARMESECRAAIEQTYASLTPMQKVQVSRFPHRPMTLDYIQGVFTDFFELHGDRRHPEDTAIVGGLASLEDGTVMVMGHQRGHSVAERRNRNHGMPNPDGLRKAHRLLQLAERFHMPVVTFVDTPGAFPGAGAEERGMMYSIARSLYHLNRLEVPVISVTVGEGGSGGALALAVGDRRLILRHSIFSVISPEGCASILWRDAAQAEKAATLLKLTADDLLEAGIMNEIIEEPTGGAHRDPAETIARVGQAIRQHLAELRTVPMPDLLAQRQSAIRDMGRWLEVDGTV